MKFILFSFLSFFLLPIVIAEIYSYSFQQISGANRQVNEFRGRPLLIVTLPVDKSAHNDSLLHILDTIDRAHHNSLKILAFPCFEDGFTNEAKDSLAAWYHQFLNDSIVVGGGVYGRRSSGLLQHGLFKWLTNDSLNLYFDQDVEGPNQKFFIKSDGSLFAVMDTGTKLSSGAVNRAIRQIQ